MLQIVMPDLCGCYYYYNYLKKNYFADQCTWIKMKSLWHHSSDVITWSDPSFTLTTGVHSYVFSVLLLFTNVPVPVLIELIDDESDTTEATPSTSTSISIKRPGSSKASVKSVRSERVEDHRRMEFDPTWLTTFDWLEYSEGKFVTQSSEKRKRFNAKELMFHSQWYVL